MKFLKQYYKTILILIVILILSLMPARDIVKPKFINIPHLDKIVHFGMYLCLTFMVLFDYSSKKKLTKIYFLLILVCIILFSGSVEFMQKYWSSGREADFFDWLANSIGVILGSFFYTFLNKKVFRRHR